MAVARGEVHTAGAREAMRRGDGSRARALSLPRTLPFGEVGAVFGGEALPALAPARGDVSGHLSLAQVSGHLDALAAAAPGAVRARRSLGTTLGGRSIDAVCVGVCDGSAPAVLLVGMHHAREPMSTRVVVDFLDALVSGLVVGDEAAAALACTRSLWAVPVLNPDGYTVNEAAPAGLTRMHRKNMHGCPGRCAERDCGVDLNRNYDFKFNADGEGSSTAPCAEDYSGLAAFSEAETSALSAFLIAHPEVTVALNFHSFGYVINIPYSCAVAGNTADAPMFAALASGMAFASPQPAWVYGQAWNSGLYTVNGEASDWMYGVHGVFAMSPEVGPEFNAADMYGFWPPEAIIPRLASEVRPMTAVAAWSAGPVLVVEAAIARVTDPAPDALGCVGVDVELLVRNAGVRGTRADVRASVGFGAAAGARACDNVTVVAGGPPDLVLDVAPPSSLGVVAAQGHATVHASGRACDTARTVVVAVSDGELCIVVSMGAPDAPCARVRAAPLSAPRCTQVLAVRHMSCDASVPGADSARAFSPPAPGRALPLTRPGVANPAAAAAAAAVAVAAVAAVAAAAVLLAAVAVATVATAAAAAARVAVLLTAPTSGPMTTAAAPSAVWTLLPGSCLWVLRRRSTCNGAWRSPQCSAS